MDQNHHLPALTLTTDDYNDLLFTAALAHRKGDANAAFLLSELRRATLCRPDGLPPEVVSIGCRVHYRLGREPQTRRHLLVHPQDLLFPGAEIAVTTPLGTALLGLRIGDRMAFTAPDGRRCEVLVEDVDRRGAAGDIRLPGPPTERAPEPPRPPMARRIPDLPMHAGSGPAWRTL